MLSGDDLIQIVDGLDSNGLLQGLHCMMTGYIGSESFLNSIAQVIERVKGQNPEVKYLCDPVLGDNDRFYVPE